MKNKILICLFFMFILFLTIFSGCSFGVCVSHDNKTLDFGDIDLSEYPYYVLTYSEKSNYYMLMCFNSKDIVWKDDVCRLSGYIIAYHYISEGKSEFLWKVGHGPDSNFTYRFIV